MKSKKNVGAYVRVSTSMQEENDSLKTQISKIESYCELHDYHLHKIYEDVGSGGDDERESFKELQRDIDNGKIDILLVYETSRISRKSNTMISFISNIIEKNVDFVSISQPDLNTTTSTGRLFFTINAGLAQYEREQISSRVKSSAYERAKKGHWMAGQLPIGYKRDEEKNIIIDEVGARQVKNFFTTFIGNQSLKKTADLFGKPVESMRWILTNPFYIGKYRFGVRKNNLHNKKKQRTGEYILVEGSQEAIINKEMFDKVQLYIKGNRALNKKNIKKSNFILGGLIKCSCMKKMYGNGNYVKKYDRLYRSYQCDNCKKKVDADLIEEQIFERLKEFEQLREINDISIDNVELVKSLEVYKNRKISILKEKDRLLTLLLKELIDESEFTKNREKIGKDLEVVTEEISNLEETIKKKEDGSDENFEILVEVSNNYKNYELIDLRELLRMIIKEIVIKDINNRKDFEYDIILEY
ncbi:MULTISPECIES: recombinase family protein [Psychrilyobacter]|uniref:Recombinase family protein n=1 Tax=Psychrilyobacter piezotolerans TaxID=2293438 RepID=A0ABX9KJ79_9FUSO|nr:MULTISPECIES: recombinase family protein [Psychrilyobacter]MCS5422213.1 recombinase family protein [Psychrilyobacter sp. S5]NDI77139.1 recombinase family protein [Psychrilyobacter piezotolerans]RDE64133.1 recombinase family protein [Psychrilyobacter sp. S5]REI42225.1 recombinase family protein [Psychrilyobacter piezotolerans]